MCAYDVFLSHSSNDETVVEELARRLRGDGLSLFLDKWDLVPGKPWQEALEKALDDSHTCAVFLGKKLGPWQKEEMRTALDERVRNGDFRVIPVLLPGARRPSEKNLPRFLRRLTWVDFRGGPGDDDAFHRLVCGIRGTPPDDRSTQAWAPPYSAKFLPRHFFVGLMAIITGLAVVLFSQRFHWLPWIFHRDARPIMRILPGEDLIALLPSNKNPGKPEYDLIITLAGGNHRIEEFELKLLCMGRERDHVKSKCGNGESHKLLEEYLKKVEELPGDFSDRLDYWWQGARIVELPVLDDDGRSIRFELQSRNDSHKVSLAYHPYAAKPSAETVDVYLSEPKFIETE